MHDKTKLDPIVAADKGTEPHVLSEGKSQVIEVPPLRSSVVHLRSPRFAYPDDAAQFRKVIVEEIVTFPNDRDEVSVPYASLLAQIEVAYADAPNDAEAQKEEASLTLSRHRLLRRVDAMD